MTCKKDGNRIACSAPPKPDFHGEDQICPHCDEAGIVNNMLCRECNGHGLVHVNKYGVSRYAMTDEQLAAVEKLGGIA